jgi:hypothetical protein
MDLGKPDYDRLRRAICREIPDRVPVHEFLVHSPTLEHVMGRNLEGGFPGFYTTTDLVAYEQARRSPLPSRRLTTEEPRPLSTLTITPEENVEFCQRAGLDAVCVLLIWTGLQGFSDRGTIRDWPDLERLLPPPDLDYVRARLQQYIDAARGTGVGVVPWFRSCFCNTYEALGYENFCLKLYDDPKLVTHLLDLFADYSIRATAAVADMDIAFFYLDDDIADNQGLLISPAMIEELWLPRTERMLAPIRARNIPIAFHCCGNLAEVIPLALRLGVNAIQPLQPNCNDIYAVKRKYGDRLCLIGNLDIAGTLAFGTPDEVVADTRAHLEALAPGGGYVVASSHSITPAVPPENFLAMVEATVRYGSY